MDGHEGNGGPMRRTRLRLRACNLYKTWEQALRRLEMLLPTQRFYQLMGFAFNLEYLDGLVGGAGG